MESDSENSKRVNCDSPNLNDSEDDSMLDFKSPETKKIKSTLRSAKPTTSLKMKVDSNLKVRVNKHKEKKKKETVQNKKSTKSQPCIESSFFKTKDTESSDSVKAGVVCPLCFKVCKDHESQALHLKICAIKHKLSTKQLMDAIELQKRQEEERKTLGLLAGPVLQERKKPVHRRVVQAQTEEADLQLGLALSKSLHEMEDVIEFNGLALYRETWDSDNSTEREPKILPQLEKFGFASSGRPTSLPKNRKRKLNEITVLQTRTEEDRNRILAERIAEILMSSDMITQELQEQEAPEKNDNKQKNMKSSLLKTLHCTDSYLWEASTLQSELVEFYVNELSEFIAPREKKTTNNADPPEIQDSSSVKQVEDSEENCETFGNQERYYEMSMRSHSEIKEENMKEECIRTLTLDWSIALNDSSASDLMINVSNGNRIWAHRLVLYVRYPNILIDVTSFNSSSVPSIKEKLDWPDVSYNVGLAFLEFVYCGSIQLHKRAKESENSLSQLRSLARRYQIQQLFNYLRKPVSQISQSNNLMENHRSVDCNIEETDAIVRPNLIKTRAVVHCNPETDFDTLFPHTQKDLRVKPQETDEILDKRNKSNESLKDDIEDSQLLSLLLNETDDEIPLSQTPKSRPLTQNRCSESNGSKTDVGKEINDNSPQDRIDMSPDLFNDTYEISNFEKNCPLDETIDEIESSLTPKNFPHSIIVTPKIPTNSPNSLKIVSNSANKEKLSSLKKQRSKLSLFIEKFKTENNRSDSDVESDASTVLNTELKRNRNPFDVRHDRIPLDSQNSPIKKNGLDALEYNLSDADTEPCSNTSKTELGVSTDEELTQWQSDLSLCTQKRTKKQEECGSKTPEKPSRISEVSNSTIDWIDLSQCETDEEDISMYTKYKKTHLHNSIADYRNYRKRIDSTSKTEREEEILNQQSPKNQGPNSGSDTDILYPDSPKNHQSSSKSSPEYFRNVNTSKPSYENISSTDNHLELVNNDESNNYTSPSTKASNDKNINTNAFESGACKKALNDKEITNEMKNVLLSPNSPKARNLKSAVWLLSSAELNMKNSKDDLEGDQSEDTIDLTFDSEVSLGKSKARDDERKVNQLEEELSLKNRSEDEMDRIFQNEIYLANVRMDDDVISEPPSPLKKSKSEGLMRSSGLSSSFLECSLVNENGSTSRTKNVSGKLSVRKLQRKSVSHGNFTVEKSNDVESSGCKCYMEKLREESFKNARRMESTSPMPDYELMDTPKLHKELSKFGLKLQKRKRAIKLLSHIYNESHPIVSKGQRSIEIGGTSDSDDDQQIYRSEDDLGEDSESSSIPPEEQEFDDIETNLETAQNIKKQFFKLIKTDRKLYNKILMFEPLPLEMLQAMLKREGLKFSKQALMDFLDKQCIAFYEPDGNRRDRRGHGSNKNKRMKNSDKPTFSGYKHPSTIGYS